MLDTLIENIVAPVFYKLLFMSVTALVVGMIIMLIRRFADKRFSPFWKYTMWVLVLVALILPWRMQSNFALMNTTEKLQEVSFSAEYTQAQTEYKIIKQSNESSSSTVPIIGEVEAKTKMDSFYIKTLIFDNIIPSVWIFGVLIIGMFMILSSLRLSRKINQSAILIGTQRYESILQSCKQKLGINRQVEIVLQSFVKTPALFGLIKPKIILPSYVENLNDEHLEYVILHELSHLKRMDGIVNTFLLILQTVYWFNPLTWLLFKFIREDMELANDASVLKNMGVAEQKEYSLSLVEVLTQYDKSSLAPRFLCMVDSEQNMERRINMIKLGEFFKRRKLVIAIAGLLVIAITATLFLTVGESNTMTNVNFSFKGEESSFAESDKHVYWVSYENSDQSKQTTWYISSFDKNGKKNFELTKTVCGNVFPLSDGRFFYAAKNGDVAAYSESGREIFNSHFDFDQNSNSNFMLNSKGELVVNLISSPNNNTSYGVININGEKTISPILTNLTTCFTHVYPLGGYITEGFSSDYKWYIARLRDDFSVEWTYQAEEYKNVYIDDISQNGKILFHGDKGESGISYLSELDPNGRVTNVNHFKSSNLTAAYFQNKIVVVADTLKIINSDFSIDKEFDALKFARIKVLENSFFIYSQGSYAPGGGGIYDGYCRRYDKNMNRSFSKVYNKDSGFAEVSDDGILYYKK